MKIEIIRVCKENKTILSRLLQLYLYEFSEMDHGLDIGRDGRYRYPHLSSYWTDPDRFPFLIHADNRIAGFILVNSQTYVCGEHEARSIAEFFILRKYRRKGIGRSAAFKVFDMFPGMWEVRQIEANLPGQQFWRKVIGAYTGDNYREVFLEDHCWRGPAQVFDSSGHACGADIFKKNDTSR